ncbi:hypothetical protein VTK56DRAFT_9107 [Thermocarpiscus australiensis]
MGLLRTLVFQLLVEFPELTPKLCPRRWEPDTFRYLASWSLDELLDALGVLRNLYAIPAQVCLFVDGLDEYQGDRDDLIRLLQNWPSPPGVKACASSRPWKEFRDAFDHLPGQLLVHKSTADVVRRYGEESLHANTAFRRMQEKDANGAESLTRAIASRDGAHDRNFCPMSAEGYRKEGYLSGDFSAHVPKAVPANSNAPYIFSFQMRCMQCRHCRVLPGFHGFLAGQAG